MASTAFRIDRCCDRPDHTGTYLVMRESTVVAVAHSLEEAERMTERLNRDDLAAHPVHGLGRPV
jgi:hypothetical protein